MVNKNKTYYFIKITISKVKVACIVKINYTYIELLVMIRDYCF